MNIKDLPRGEIQDSITHLIEALCHKIRTPLSVISNDLVFLETTLGPSEVERSKRKIEEIKNILRECSEIVNLPRNNVSLGEIAEVLKIDYLPPEEKNAQIVNGAAVKLGIVYLQKLIEHLRDENVLPEIAVESDTAVISLLVKASIKLKLTNIEIFNALNLTSQPQAALSNLLLVSNGATIIGEPDENCFQLKIIVPKG